MRATRSSINGPGRINGAARINGPGRIDGGGRINGLCLTAVTAALALALANCAGPPTPPGTSQGNQSGAVSLNVVDVGGVSSFTKPMMDKCAQSHPDRISGLAFSKAPSTELTGKLEAQQKSGHLDIDLVLSGSDAVGAGVVKNIWEPISDHENQLPALKNYSDDARMIFDQYKRQALVVATEFTGPLLEYTPGAVSTPPTTAEELLAYAKANPGKFTYAKPPQSGPGRQFVMGLPYILGDKDPKDPKNGWDKTWAYLAELDKYVGGSYPSSTGDTFESLAKGGVNMIASSAGWDIGQRQQGTVPATLKITTLKNSTYLIAGHFAAIPKGLQQNRREAVLALLDCMLSKDSQTSIYQAQKKSVPGPAIKGISVKDAPADVQGEVAQFDRPEYQQLIGKARTAPELPPEQMSIMFDRWEREIGG